MESLDAAISGVSARTISTFNNIDISLIFFLTTRPKTVQLNS